MTGLHTAHLNFDEKILIDVVNYYEHLLRNYKECKAIDSNLVIRHRSILSECSKSKNNEPIMAVVKQCISLWT